MIRILGVRGRAAMLLLVALTIGGLAVALAERSWVDVFEVLLLGIVALVCLGIWASARENMRVLRRHSQASRKRVAEVRRLHRLVQRLTAVEVDLRRNHQRHVETVAELSQRVRELTSRVTYPALVTPVSEGMADGVADPYAGFTAQPIAVKSDRISALCELLTRDATRRHAEESAVLTELTTLKESVEELMSMRPQAPDRRFGNASQR